MQAADAPPCIELAPAGTGWVAMTLTAGPARATAIASDLADGDALAALVAAAHAMLEGAAEACVRIDGESVRWCWLFDRAGERVRHRVVATSIAGDDGETWHDELETWWRAPALAAAVVSAVRRLAAGPPGALADAWRHHPLPLDALAALEAALTAR